MVPRPKIFALDADTPPGEVGHADRRERLLAHPRLRGLDRQRGGRRLRQGRAAPAREAPAGGDPQDPPPRAPRAGDEEGGRAAEGAAEAAQPHGDRGRRARLGERPRDPRGPARADRRARSRTSTTGRSARSSGCATARWSWRGRCPAARAARGATRSRCPSRRVRDRGRLHARAARLGAEGRRGGRARGLALTVVDVERNRISKVKIEKLPAGGAAAAVAAAAQAVRGRSPPVQTEAAGRSFRPPLHHGSRGAECGAGP